MEQGKAAPKILRLTNIDGLPIALKAEGVQVINRAKTMKRDGPKPEDVKHVGEHTEIGYETDKGSLMNCAVQEPFEQVVGMVWPAASN